MASKLLSSLETEYAITAFHQDGRPLNSGSTAQLLYDILQQLPETLPDPGNGRFLVNGGRFYIDSGDHPEYAAPECAGHPRELLAHIRAGDQLFISLAQKLENSGDIREVWALRGNVDYSNLVTWGSHSNDLSAHSTGFHTENLLPYLASRVIYGGAGGWHPFTCGLQFVLSPRLLFFCDSRGDRNSRTGSPFHRDTAADGLISTREEAHGKNCHRVHITCRDNVQSDTAELLMCSVLRLLIHLSDLGYKLGAPVALRSPLGALKTICMDHRCRSLVPLSSGKSITAIGIQQHYLDEIARQASELPDWTPQILSLWQEVLDKLRCDPLSLAGVLDWPTKYLFFQCQLPDHSRAGVSFAGGDRAQLDSFAALKQEMLQLDIMFADLRRGFWQRLAKPGGILISRDEIEQALAKPPDSTRAKLRGNLVKRLHDAPDHYCNWTFVRGPGRKLLLDDPFEKIERWQATFD